MHTTSRLTPGAVLLLALIGPSLHAHDKPSPPEAKALKYTIELIETPVANIMAINNKESVLVERQLVAGASSVPFIIKRHGEETAVVQCPGTTNDTTGEGLNNVGQIVGHCGHAAGSPGLFAFIADPRRKHMTLLSYPGALTTWGYGINDFGQVVGFYVNQPPSGRDIPPSTYLHSFAWDPETNQYYTIDNPLAATVGGWTFLQHINNRGQIAGHYNTSTNVPWEEFQFVYQYGTFTPIAVPGASQTHITGLNNRGQIIGWSDVCDAVRCPFLYDAGEYAPISLPLPANAPLPDGSPTGFAALSSLGGLNDDGQFVGTYIQILEWGIDQFGSYSPFRQAVRHFVATPRHKGR